MYCTPPRHHLCRTCFPRTLLLLSLTPLRSPGRCSSRPSRSPRRSFYQEPPLPRPTSKTDLSLLEGKRHRGRHRGGALQLGERMLRGGVGREAEKRQMRQMGERRQISSRMRRRQRLEPRRGLLESITCRPSGRGEGTVMQTRMMMREERG